jgi:hypothetical protein
MVAGWMGPGADWGLHAHEEMQLLSNCGMMMIAAITLVMIA